jgi:hypothetical protein
MHPEQLALTVDDINGERYDMSVEMSACRQHIASLFALEAKTREKYPGRDDVLLAIKAQQQEAIADFVKTAKFVRDIENAGQVFTSDRVAALLDKVASIVMFRVSDMKDRQNTLEDISDLMSSFRKSYERGTLVTPDHDALMMDDTIPDQSTIDILSIGSNDG